MKRWQEYTDKAIDVAALCLKQAGEYADAAVDVLDRRCRKSKRKIKRNLNMMKFKRSLNTVCGVMIVVAASLAIVKMILSFLKDYES